MTLLNEDKPPTAGPSFRSTSPGGDELVGTFAVDDPAAVSTAVQRARAASTGWGALGFEGRARCLAAWRGHIARHLDELAELVHNENGKPKPDAVLEITLAVDHIAWAGKHAAKVLGRRRVRSGLLAANQAATVEYQPFGVVGVIGPWNYPVFTPMGSLAYALAAGNAVVFKPSEWTPAIGAWLVDAWRQAVPDRPDVLTLVTGFGPTGAALCRAGVDKIAFTGSARTGRAVMAACADNLIPVLMECGGKDALIVDDDADVDAAADAALWGAMSNGGQTCIGIERVYATDQVYDRFVSALAARARKLHPGTSPGASYGPATMPSQLDVIRRHIDDAVAGGGKAVVGGPGAVHDGLVDPTVLVDVPEESAAVQEETFGPTITVARVADADEAVERANATGYGLAGAVFTGSRRRGEELAYRLRSGMASVNSVISFAAVPGLPFGGVGESGFGRIHGPDGLREFTRSKAVTAQRWALPVNLMSFDRPAVATDVLAKAMKLLHGRNR
jgi:acyl-CoA reductase-like NAD-dependent aldehyde dehydrogenase